MASESFTVNTTRLREKSFFSKLSMNIYFYPPKPVFTSACALAGVSPPPWYTGVGLTSPVMNRRTCVEST